MDTTEFLATFFAGIFAGVLITVFGEWLNDYRKRLKMHVDLAITTLTKTPTRHSMIIGFGISIEQGKELKDAYVRCNGQRYPWYEDGKPKETIQLFVGEQPNWFYPYGIILDYVDDLSSQKNIVGLIKREEQSNHGILLRIEEINKHDVVLSKYYSMPKNSVGFNQKMHERLIDASMTLIGKGIERKMSYYTSISISRIIVGKLKDGVPSLDTVDCEFTIAALP
jgi:hypothetical protein